MIKWLYIKIFQIYKIGEDYDGKILFEFIIKNIPATSF